ncbi:hypothetical protein JTS93_09725 [Clostridium botulinum]|nr:hypothetical protein [Clostridium botulinum]
MGNKRDNILVNNMDIKVITTLEERIIPALYDYVYIVKMMYMIKLVVQHLHFAHLM